MTIEEMFSYMYFIIFALWQVAVLKYLYFYDNVSYNYSEIWVKAQTLHSLNHVH